jgi:drug/metabolite transporter (DMT)-like permease
MAPEWLWIPLTVWAGFAQTLRNAAQRHLVADLGTLGATLVRFLFGLPFALIYLGVVLAITGEPVPGITPLFVFWVTEGGVSQILATALLLRVMHERNFAVGVAYSKTELVQVAVFAAVFLGDKTTLLTVIAIVLATTGVLMLSPVDPQRRFRSLAQGWTSHTALMGVACGGLFALAAVGYRGAALELKDAPFTLAAAYSLVWAMSIQVVLLGGWLFWRQREVVMALVGVWRTSMLAGFMGAAASVGWFTAFAIEPAAHVRTLGLVELLFSFAVARRFFQERLAVAELGGVALLMIALVMVTLGA